MNPETGHPRSEVPQRPAENLAQLTDKAVLRADLLSARRALSPGVRRAADRQLLSGLLAALSGLGAAVWRSGVAAYLPFGTEPGAAAVPSLPDTLADAGLRVLLPVLLPDHDLDWAVYQGDLANGLRGMREPVGVRLGPDAVRSVTAVVVPAVAVDHSGVRLGRGGGSYDRALARVPDGVPVIAVLYDAELVPQLPAETHDQRVTAVVTPGRGLVTLAPSSGRTGGE